MSQEKLKGLKKEGYLKKTWMCFVTVSLHHFARLSSIITDPKFRNSNMDLCTFSMYHRKDFALFFFFSLPDLLFLHIENQSHLMHRETLSLKAHCLSLWVILSAKSCEIIIDFKSQQQKYLIFGWQTVKEEPSGSVLNVNEIRFMLG